MFVRNAHGRRAGGAPRPALWAAAAAMVFVAGCGDESLLTIPVDDDGPLHSTSSASSPDGVTDLTVVETTASSVTLSWTEVDDGAGSPADYTIRYADTPLGHGWGQATLVLDGECASPISGSQVGGTFTCTVNDLDEDTSHDFRLVSYRQEDDGRVFGPLSNVVTAVTEDPAGDPGGVTDLSVVETGPSSVTLSWTEVDDGAGSPADYTVRYADTPLGYGWGQATWVTDGECASPISGSRVGGTFTCTVNDLDEGTSYDFRLVSYRQEDDGRVFGPLSNVTTAVTEDQQSSESVSAGDPGEVTDLSVVETGPSSVTLSWTEVDDGAGSPADYTVRYADTPFGHGWGQATWVTDGECASPISGSQVGGTFTCTVNGLDEDTSYDFRLVSYREEDDGRVFGPLSNTTTAVTSASNPPSSETETGGSTDSSNLYPNEPSSFRTYSERHFNQLEEAGWRSDTSNSNLSIVSDPTAPVSGTNVGRVRYPAGSTGGRTPAWSENWQIQSEGLTSLYVSFWMKVSDNWQGHSSGVNKIGFIWTHGDPSVFPVMRGANDAALRGVIYLQNVPDGGQRLDANMAEGRIDRGQWHQWEVVLVSNTGSNSDGEVHWWIDGRKVGEYTNIRFGTSSQSKHWERVAWRPIWGGIGGEVRETMYMWMDRAYISGSR